MKLSNEEFNEIVSNFNPTYFDTVSGVKMNIFAKRKDMKKIGVRWCLRAKHGNSEYLFAWGDKVRRGTTGLCLIRTPYRNILIERAPEQVSKWCDEICGENRSLEQINSTKWETMVTW